MDQVLFENAALLDPHQDELQERAWVLVEAETIREVSSRPIRAPNATAVRCDGRTLMPGLIDCHTHVYLS